jgi:hypothetical protein
LELSLLIRDDSDSCIENSDSGDSDLSGSNSDSFSDLD